MTIPQRGLWKNSVLGGVLAEHQIKTPIQSLKKFRLLPVGITAPPDVTHHNNHTASPLPGHKARLRPPTASPADSASQTKDTRKANKFIPGTASAVSPHIVGNAKQVPPPGQKVNK